MRATDNSDETGEITIPLSRQIPENCVKCDFCGLMAADFVPTDQGYTCHECVKVFVEVAHAGIQDDLTTAIQALDRLRRRG